MLRRIHNKIVLLTKEPEEGFKPDTYVEFNIYTVDGNVEECEDDYKSYLGIIEEINNTNKQNTKNAIYNVGTRVGLVASLAFGIYGIYKTVKAIGDIHEANND